MNNRDKTPPQAAGPWEEGAEPVRGRLLRLAISCPRCGARPALRITEHAARAMAEHPPEERVGTYQCQRRQCGHIYDLHAAAYHRAS